MNFNRRAMMKRQNPWMAMVVAVAVVLGGVGTAWGTEWQTDFEAARGQAKKEGKPILMDFTGSDWCGWCIKMKKDTLDQKEFKEYAKKDLVLVQVDFPNKKKLSSDQKKANEALKAKYGVQGFPTYVLVDATGKELGRQVGYLQGGPSAFTSKIEGWKK
jgi:protein disulfide-isomerase